MVIKRKRCFTGQFHAKFSRAFHLLPHGFCRIFTSGRYHRDMKVLKILASNFRRFRVSGIFKKLQVDDDKWDHQIEQLLR